jgi:hypothetical protein
MRQKSLTHHQGRKRIDLKGLCKTVEIHIQRRLFFRPDNARIVDENIDTSLKPVCRFQNCRLVGDIECQNMNIVAEPGFHRFRVSIASDSADNLMAAFD